MDAMSKIGVALLVVLLLPAIVAEWEGRRLPDIFHAALGLGGLLFALATGGTTALIAALATAIAGLALLAAVVAGARSLWFIRLMRGSDIKLLAAGSAWLGAGGTLAMIGLVALLFVLTVVVLRVRNNRPLRPELTPLVAIAAIGVFLCQNQTQFLVF
jgi:Flp pilus assembly protein protease CpaA